jgi:hypothetical protein
MTATPHDMRSVSTSVRRANLSRTIYAARENVEHAKQALREAEIAIDDFERENRPSYPTTEMRLALEKAAEDVKDNHRPSSHLGRKISDSVSAHGDQGFIWVDAQSPYGQSANGRLWNFTAAEVDEIRAHLESLGLVITEHWTHERGHSFITKHKEEK